jgi:hypothetical protein
VLRARGSKHPMGDCKCAETRAQLRHLSAAAAVLAIAGSSATEAITLVDVLFQHHYIFY